jgi:hypothetical protein
MLVNDIMHCEIVGETVKHIKKFFNFLKTNHDDSCWAKVSQLLRKIQKYNHYSPSRQFISEQTFFKLTAFDKMQVMKFIDPILDQLTLPDDANVKERAALLKLHCRYVRKLVQPTLTDDELDEIMDCMLEVRKRGSVLYHDNAPEQKYFKGFLTINSHYLTHTKLQTELYGVPRNQWVFIYESVLGRFKKYLEGHRNGKSEGRNFIF